MTFRSVATSAPIPCPRCSSMLAVFAEFEAGLLKMRTREGMAHRPLPRQAQRQQAQAHHTPAGRVLDRAGARPGAGRPVLRNRGRGRHAQGGSRHGGVRALVISQADEKRVVRLAEPLLHQPLRAGDSLLLESWSGVRVRADPQGRGGRAHPGRRRAGQTRGGYAATAARTSASCVDDVDDDQGAAVVEIGDRHHRGAERRSCPGARSRGSPRKPQCYAESRGALDPRGRLGLRRSRSAPRRDPWPPRGPSCCDGRAARRDPPGRRRSHGPSANRSPYQVPRLILSGCPSTGVA